MDYLWLALWGGGGIYVACTFMKAEVFHLCRILCPLRCKHQCAVLGLLRALGGVCNAHSSSRKMFLSGHNYNDSSGYEYDRQLLKSTALQLQSCVQ